MHTKSPNLTAILVSVLMLTAVYAQEPAAPAPSSPQSAAAAAVRAPGGTIRGSVKAGTMPLPGVTISAANTLTGKKIFTSTDTNGRFELTITGKGRWVVRAELVAFAPGTKEVLFNAENAGSVQQADFGLILLSRQQQQEQPDAQAMQQIANAVAGRGYQNLGLTQSEGGDTASPLAGADAAAGAMPAAALGADSASESVSVNGAMGRTENFSFDENELRQRMEEARASGQLNFGGGGPGGAPGGGPMVIQLGGGGGGGFRIGGPGGRGRRFDINKPHGMVYYNFGNSALDARSYSLNGVPAPKPDYGQSRYGFFLGGPLSIPGVIKPSMQTMYFLNYFGQTASNPFDVFAIVPTAAERQGDFSQTVVRGGPNAGNPVTIYDPATGLPYPGNVIPNGSIRTAALGLLGYFPLPNQTAGSRQNFHRVTSSDTNSHNINFRLIHNFGDGSQSGNGNRSGGGGRGIMFGARNSLNVGFSYRTSNADIRNYSPFLGGASESNGYNVNVNYVHGIGKFTSRTGFTFNTNHFASNGLYANKTDVAGGLGITGVSTNPFDFGVPSLSFTNYSGLRDVTPVLRDDRTFSFNENVSWTQKKHRVRFGGDFRRSYQDQRSNANPRGGYVFNGLATSDKLGGTAGSGYDLADFLLGLPQQTSIQFSANTYHYNNNAFGLFILDDWRVRGNLTLNIGLRYEYSSPWSESSGQLVNLDAATGFTAVAPVCASALLGCSTTGPFTGAFPQTLVEPDRNNFAPRIGIAWTPVKKTVVRAGYGINYNLGQYASIAQQFANQPPFATTATNLAAQCPLITLADGFSTCASAVTNNFGVDRHYRLGYAQTWNLSVQRELPLGLMMNVDYTGTKGTHLDLLRAPNRGPAGLLIPGVQPFEWESSVAGSILHAGTVRVRKRLTHGIAFGGSYTYSKSLDNASSIGGGTGVVAQNDLDLAAERGLSSFDQRHRFTGDYTWELPWGTGKRWLNHDDGLSRAFGDWMLTGSITLASGLPRTARVLGAPAEIAQGTNGTLRADYNGQAVHVSDPTIQRWFNTAAFTVPAAGTFGNSQRNMIIGPGTINFGLSMSKTIPIRDTKAFEFRASATNLFNHPNYSSIDTAVNSPTFGQVTGVAGMRAIQIQTRFRF